MIRLDRVDFFYEEGNYLFKNFSVTLNYPKKYLISGSNGSGKTTLLKIIIGMFKVKSGTVKQDFNRKFTLYIPSTPFYEPFMSLEKFVYFYLIHMLKLPRDRMNLETILAELSLEAHRQTLCKDLSKGTLQKVLLAPLFTTYNWQCIFMDEPFEHLDLKTCEQVEQKIAESSALVVLINHKEHLLSSTLRESLERIEL